jgi:hypothetical protein
MIILIQRLLATLLFPSMAAFSLVRFLPELIIEFLWLVRNLDMWSVRSFLSCMKEDGWDAVKLPFQAVAVIWSPEVPIKYNLLTILSMHFAQTGILFLIFR